MLTESSVVNFFQNAFPHYIGDDAAIIPFSEDECYVFTKDLLVEDIHFRIRYHDASNTAYKALSVNLSDIAAMGATPKYVLLGLSIPQNYDIYNSLFMEGFIKACQEANVILIGGDTTKSDDKFYISVTLIGTIASKNIKFRKNAKVGDIICVAGELGYAHLGFYALERHKEITDVFKNAFLRPKARVKEGIWLGGHEDVGAMMDISDGLYIDLARLCKASGVGAILNLDKLHYAQKFRAACKQLDLECVKTQLIGGEDYSLLFTVNKKSHDQLITQFASEFGYEIKTVGEVTKDCGIHLFQHNIIQTFQLETFEHFKTWK